MGKTVRDVLEELRSVSQDEVEKGRRFEHLMLAFLRNDLQYSKLFDEVWLWADYPNRNGRPDTGIDLVARERGTGELVAIQCKFYAPDTVISKPAVDSFLATSSKAEFGGRLLITTSDHWGKNAKDALVNQTPPVSIMSVADLDESSIDWSKFSLESLGSLTPGPVKQPRPHQEAAIRDCLDGLREHDRGRLIMACGTGKTFTSLRLTERHLPNGGFVLFLVPSISLLSQGVKEWSINSEADLLSFAVCSDVSAGRRKNEEDLPVTDLAFPATTDAKGFMQKFQDSKVESSALKVVFSTYQSISVVAEAQRMGFPKFDLIICDEAHRTAGVTSSGEETKTFMKVHDENFISSQKRLYMTATPKVFSDAAARKAEEQDAVLADMNDEAIYGPEFHRLGFGEAVERDILTDYKVLVLAVDEQYVAEKFQRELAAEDNQLNLEDTAKIVGCWNGLSKRGLNPEDFNSDPEPMKRAVAFARSIAESKLVATMFQQVVDKERALDGDTYSLRCEVQHVDGTFSSFDRNEKLDWLKQEPAEGTARILSNARCLTEGVDVPALDAIMFLKPRESQIDVVQAVGRVMRKLDGKKYGYVILPIAVAAGIDPETALSDNKKYKVVWQVLQALRSHDERFDAMVNRINLTGKSPQIDIIGVGGEGPKESLSWGESTLQFPNFELWKDAILAKIVEKVGERRYWENWAKDIAEIARQNVVRISNLVSQDSGPLRQKFERFKQGLQDNLNPSITESDCIEMLAQHIITKPIFDSLFTDYNFANKNPVSIVMEDMVAALSAEQLEKESAALEKFYESVRVRATGITDVAAKQTLMKQLYEEFFKNAFKDTSDRLGIVYTPNEVVDFIIQSVNDALIEHFDTRISERGVHIVDPFTGTGTFIVRLLQSGLLSKTKIANKYRYELHANELVLLAYYVAAINIEETYHSIVGGAYEPFNGIVLTDTFQMHEKEDSIDGLGVFPENNSRTEHQLSLDIRVVMGNPPYSVGADSENDAEKNLKYPTLDGRVLETYAALSTAGLKRNLYDSYVRAIRWASDRVGDNGVVCFVSNGSFIESASGDGIRKALYKEFSNIYVVNLRGNARTYGEKRRREGDNVFGEGARTPVAIYCLVKRADNEADPSIKYHDIGDNLKLEDKLKKLSELRSIADVPWSEIKPNQAGDWLQQRDEAFQRHPVLGQSSKSPSSRNQVSVFRQHSLGIVTSRDSWVTNFSRNALTENVVRTIDFFNKEIKHGASSDDADLDPRKISWSRSLKKRLDSRKVLAYDDGAVRVGTYRPFVKQWIYLDSGLVEMPSQVRKFLPSLKSDNPILAISGPANTGDFSCLMVNQVPFFHIMSQTQVFGRYTYELDETIGLTFEGEDTFEGYRRIDNITDEMLAYTRQQLNSPAISKDDIFYYVYGLLHSEEFRKRYGHEITAEIARVPISSNFRAFAEAGAKLADLHLNYETLEKFEAVKVPGSNNWGSFLKARIYKSQGEGREKEFSVEFGGCLTLSGLPERALEYRIGPRSPIEWVVERYQRRVDVDSGIETNPTDWFKLNGSESYLPELILRLVTMSIKTIDIVQQLPDLDIID